MTEGVGCIDTVSDGKVHGWAYAGREAEIVEVRIGEVLVGRVNASNMRYDLVAEGIGSGRHGFVCPIPHDLRFDKSARISASINDGRLLLNSSRTLESLLADQSVVFDETGQRIIFEPHPQAKRRARGRNGSLVCSICGGAEFREQLVLSADLIAQWQLSRHEVDYINRQQGQACVACGANLRIIALAEAVCASLGTSLPLRSAVTSGAFDAWRVLDINGADAISPALAILPHYQQANFPECNMEHLPFADNSFDLVLHSDTLEHVERPLRALEECQRVLKAGRRLCFTAPIIVGRLSRSRAGLLKSYHGDPSALRDDYVVHTEFGSDIWTLAMTAGFSTVAFSQVEYPSGIAISAWVDAPPVQDPQSSTASNVSPARSDIYDQDGLRSVHNHDFMADPVFIAAYARGVKAVGSDYHWQWRVHVSLWAAATAAKLPGDFVEFGVNRGFVSSAIMQMLDWNATGRTFYLLDTFSGIDYRYVSPEDFAKGVVQHNEQAIASGFYTLDVDAVRRNFAEWPKTRIIVGPVPETLPQVTSMKIAFAHIDMNCALPEVAAAEFIWDRLVPGAIVLLDDYAYTGYHPQKIAMDQFAQSKGVAILSCPTGQGLMIKPAHMPLESTAA